MMMRRIWIGSICALVALAWSWVRFHRSQLVVENPAKQPAPFIQMAGDGAGSTDQILREKAEYFDPTPLFFPTEWNYGHTTLPLNLRQGMGQVFVSFPPNFTASELGIKDYASIGGAGSERLPDILSAGNQAPFAGFGRFDLATTGLVDRSAFLEVRGFGNRDTAINQALVGLPFAPVDFDPIEYLATVGPAGLIGDLSIVSGSGVDETDVFFRNYLVNAFRLGARLAPGQYQVRVGP